MSNNAHPIEVLREAEQKWADDTHLHPADRIDSLCELYFLYQGDIVKQTDIVKQIRKIAQKI